AAGTPLKATFVAPSKLVPKMLTTVPTGPAYGVKELMNGETSKSFLLAAVPASVVTVMGPVAAPRGTVARIWQSLMTTGNAAGMSLKATTGASVSPVPEIVTTLPT